MTAASPCVPETIYETDETVLWFLAVDPDGEYESGEATRWTNRLTFTHHVTVLGGKRRVDLTVKPRGTLRWNTTGANPKEGTVYAGAIDLAGDSEIIVYIWAEDHDVGMARNFTIPRVDHAGPSIVKTKPARLGRNWNSRAVRRLSAHSLISNSYRPNLRAA